MRDGVQIGAVHRVHDVVDGVSVVALPRRGAEEGAELLAHQLLGQGQLGRLGVRLVAEIEEDCALDLLHGIGADALSALDRAFLEPLAGVVEPLFEL